MLHGLVALGMIDAYVKIEMSFCFMRVDFIHCWLPSD